jgi:mannose-6-phosphate isomerase
VIANLQGRPIPSPAPEAELWVGAHPAAPSRLLPGGIPLTEVIAASPSQVLSEPVVRQFGHRLPYLLKLLAAAAPLSLQVHPDEASAAAGYAAEESAGVPRQAPHRRYVDPYHKPELLVAVSEFHARCGFRPPAASAALLARLGVPALDPVIAALRAGDLAAAVRSVLAAGEPAELVAQVAAAARRVEQGASPPASAGSGALRSTRELDSIRELAAAYPGDLGVVLALLLNEVRLAPTEAIFMPAGNLHTYLHGTGVEIMAASDNVLRGGLTSKHVDVPELQRVLRYQPLPDPVLRPTSIAAGVSTWPVPVAEFSLYRVLLDAGVRRAELILPGPRSVLCLAGEIRVADGVAPITLRSGEAGFARAGGARRLALSGAGEAYVAAVGEI